MMAVVVVFALFTALMILTLALVADSQSGMQAADQMASAAQAESTRVRRVQADAEAQIFTLTDDALNQMDGARRGGRR